MVATGIQGVSSRSVASFTTLLKTLLDEAAAIKPPSSDRASSIEPPLNKHDFPNFSERVAESLSDITAEEVEGDDASKAQVRSRKFAVIESVVRDATNKLIASTPITDSRFIQVWNLLDIISSLFLEDQCEPALPFWLIEELMDSQTIAGCRIVFSYFESRREQITSKHFKSTYLVILRSCNELLRRLSRAEDTAFCGRVFIFLFQVFPLGDRSSVNLRGEYHVENVTGYEESPEEENKMDVDTQEDTPKEAPKETQTDKNGKPLRNGDKKKKEDEKPPLPASDLYKLFWPLQETFSQPLTLFQPDTFKSFRAGVEETVRKFKTYPSDEGPRSTTVDEPKQALKRKRDDSESSDEQPEAFNPKYLTSKDLFELEIGDLQFRRHILVQMLIVLNFVLSWTPEAKKKYKLMETTNNSVMYAGEFSPEAAKWAEDTRYDIEGYLRRGFAGKIFHRMVDTVLSRDKNWVYWKMRGCQPIQRDPVSAKVWAEAQDSARRMTTNKRLRPTPLNAVNMDFLKEKDTVQAMLELQDPKRYKVPELDDFKALIADDEFEISMAANDAAKTRAIASKASKSWRAMRIARNFKLAAFDKIDDPTDISAVFEPLEDIDAKKDEEETAEEDDFPSNRETVIVTGPSGVGKSALVEKLLEAHKGVFGRVVRHTTREPTEGETDGKTYHFVKPLDFNQLRDGDRLIEYSEQGKVSYGTSSKAIESVTESGKVAVIEMDIDAAKFAKDMMDFPGRYILITPPTPSTLQTRLSSDGNVDEETIKAIIDAIPSEAQAAELSNKVIVNDDIETAAKGLSDFIYEAAEESEGEEAKGAADDMQVDAPAAES